MQHERGINPSKTGALMARGDAIRILAA